MKIKPADNSTYPKVAVQWLNQALCFYQNLCLVDSEVLRNRHLRVAAKRCSEFKKMKNLAKKIGVFTLLFSLISWIPKLENNGALVTISMTTKGAMQKGYGIIMTLANTETKEIYKSKSLGPISPHAMFKELPEGTYVVTKIEVPLGQLMYINQSQELTDFFGELTFKSGNAYYLGNFKGNREIGRKNVFHLWLDKPDIHPKLLKKLGKKKIELTDTDLIKTFPYEKEKLTIY